LDRGLTYPYIRSIINLMMAEVSQKYIKDIQKNGASNLLTMDEEIELAKKIKKGCKQSLEELIHKNLKLVIKTARKYEGCGVDLMDLINEGNVGLAHAAKRFESSKNTKFSTYAGYWIRQKMIRYINNHGRTIRIPCHAYALFCSLKKEYEDYKEFHGTEPGISYLANKLNTTKRKIKSLILYVNSPIYLDGNIAESEEDKKEQHIPSETLDASDILQKKETDNLIQEALDKLTKREKYIIEHRFGMHGDKKETLEVIGKKFKITRERIRQIDKAALIKLKNILKEMKTQ
jgi:RNA polymerase primary sigma factor